MTRKAVRLQTMSGKEFRIRGQDVLLHCRREVRNMINSNSSDRARYGNVRKDALPF